MRRVLIGLGVAILVAVAPSAASGAPIPTQAHVPPDLPAHSEKAVCGHALPDAAECTAHVVTGPDGATPLATISYTNGYAPLNLASAYNWSNATGGVGQTVAVVDAYDNPNAESDLAAYRAQFGLPVCSTANGCFRKVNQRGAATPPAANVGWGQEIDLDIEMASAVCANCKILLVEADSNSLTNLGIAVNEAATLGATAISNSYATSGEFSTETSYEGYYNHPNIAVTASSGDSGYGVGFPAVSRYVVAVGGTTLKLNAADSTRASETAWSGTGSGCSAYVTKPTWQKDAGCSNRTVVDVAAVADPNTGVAVYDSYGSSGGANWYVFGGTSVSAPIIASLYALAGNNAGLTPQSYPYSHTSSLFDVTSGSNGNCAGPGKSKAKNSSPPYLCTAGPGYDGPTGLGTPNGTGAF